MRPLAVLRMTPWRRGPMLLVRRPGVALALLAAALVATLPVRCTSRSPIPSTT